jgi:hypothetical protein
MQAYRSQLKKNLHEAHENLQELELILDFKC